MRDLTDLVLATLAGCCSSLAAQIPGIGPVGPVTRADTGFTFTEGPAQDAGGNLYFSDVQGNRIHRVDPNGNRTTFLDPSGNANGIFFDRDDRMLVCQHAGRVIEVDVNTKAVTVLAGTHNNVRFNSPNDLVADAFGGFWFTDPTFGGNFQDKQGVYYRAAGGAVTRLIDNLTSPNGIMLSVGETTLYVASSNPQAVMAYPVLGPGVLGAGAPFFPLGSNTVDGMSIDTNGNLYLTRPNQSAIEVVTPAGVSLGRFTVPERPSNCAFGGKDLRTLFITARTSLYKADMLSTGQRPARLLASAGSVPVLGGRVDFAVHTTPVHNLRLYAILASASGTAPGLVLESTRIPINLDAFTALALELATTPVLANFVGLLDANGTAAASLNLPPLDGSLVGVAMDFAMLTALPIDGASNARRVRIVP
jgi:gluconolactonase